MAWRKRTFRMVNCGQHTGVPGVIGPPQRALRPRGANPAPMSIDPARNLGVVRRGDTYLPNTVPGSSERCVMVLWRLSGGVVAGVVAVAVGRVFLAGYPHYHAQTNRLCAR